MVLFPKYLCVEGTEACAVNPKEEFYTLYQIPNTIYHRLDNLAMEKDTNIIGEEIEWICTSSMGKAYKGREQIMYKLTHYYKPNWGSNQVAFYYYGTHPQELIATMTYPWIIKLFVWKKRMDQKTCTFRTDY